MAIIPRGVNIYLVRVYLGRDPVSKKRIEINRTVHGTLTSAKKVEAKLKSQKESGYLLKTPRMPLNILLDLYSDSSRHLQSETTQDKDRMYFDYYIRPYIGPMPIVKINRSVIQELFNLLLDEKKDGRRAKRGERVEGGRGLAPNTVKNIRKVLRAAFNYAINEKLITGNPVHKTKLPPVTGSSANAMTIEEAKALVSVKDDFWYGDAFVFQLHTGLRPQELMSLIWEDIDFEQGTVRIERACKWIRGVFSGFGTTKCIRSDRIIGLAPEHLELLKLHHEKQKKVIAERKAMGKPYGESKIKEWVMKARTKQSHLYDSARLIFPKPDGMVPNHTVPRTELKVMLERAGIRSGETNYRWYDLRHTHATFLLAFGLPDREIAERMGHSILMLLTMYAHFIKSRRSVAANLFVKHIPVKSEPIDSSSEEDKDDDSETED
jgi:integrase